MTRPQNLPTLAPEELAARVAAEKLSRSFRAFVGGEADVDEAASLFSVADEFGVWAAEAQRQLRIQLEIEADADTPRRRQLDAVRKQLAEAVSVWTYVHGEMSAATAAAYEVGALPLVEDRRDGLGVVPVLGLIFVAARVAVGFMLNAGAWLVSAQSLKVAYAGLKLALVALGIKVTIDVIENIGGVVEKTAGAGGDAAAVVAGALGDSVSLGLFGLVAIGLAWVWGNAR